MLQQQQPNKVWALTRCIAKETGCERMENGRREQLFSLASLVSEDGDEKDQQVGIRPQQLCQENAELCEEEEEEEEEHQQLPSTVDSVASSTDSNGLGGGDRIRAELLREALCKTGSNAIVAFSVLACAKKVRSLSNTPLLAAAVAPEIPTLQALCDSQDVSPLPLPLPAPLNKDGTLKAEAIDDTGGAPKDGEDKSTGLTAAAGELLLIPKGGKRAGTGENAAATLAGEAMQKNEDEETEQEQIRKGSATSGAPVAAAEKDCGKSAAILEATCTDAAGAGTRVKKTEIGGGGGRKEREEKGTAKSSNGDDANVALSVRGKEESVIMSFKTHGRKKQSAAEQGRIAAAAVVATTQLFSREEGESSSTRCSFTTDPQRGGVIQRAQPQKGSAGGREAKSFFPPATAPHTPLRGQRKHQEHGYRQHQLERAETSGWCQRSKERREKLKALLSFGKEQETYRQQRDQVMRQQQVEEQQEIQGNKQALFTHIIGSAPQEDKTFMRTSSCVDEGESPALLLSHGSHLLSSDKSGMEHYQQHLQRLEKLWAARGDTEAEKQRMRMLLGQGYTRSSSSSLSSLLQQQQGQKADAPSSFLFSAAASQHEMSMMNSSLATVSPRRTSTAKDLTLTVASGAINRELTDALATAASRDERTVWMARDNLTQPKREVYGSAFFQDTASERDNSASQPSVAERDAMLTLIDLPRVLSLTTQASFSDRHALDYRMYQQSRALSSPKKNDKLTPSSFAASNATAAFSGTDGDAAAAASVAASLHAFSPAAAASRKGSRSATSHQHQPCPGADLPSTTVVLGESADTGVAAPAAPLPRIQGGRGRAEETDQYPVTSLSLQAEIRPPPGLQTQARKNGVQDEPSQSCKNLSEISNAVATSGACVSSSARRHSITATLLASATEESLAAAVAALAAGATTPLKSAAVVPPGIQGEKLSGGIADVSRKECLLLADDILRVAGAAAATGELGRNTCSNITDRAGDMLNVAASLSQGASPSWPFRERKSSFCAYSNPLSETASKNIVLAALARQAATTGTCGVTLAATATSKARQQDLETREGEATLRLSQPSRIGIEEAAATVDARAGIGIGLSRGETAAESKCSSSLYVPSYQGGGLRNVLAGDNESRAEPMFMKYPVGTIPSQNYRETHSQQHHEKLCIMSRCGREIQTANGTRVFGAAATEGGVHRRSGTEGREMAMESGRAISCGVASSYAFPSFGGRGYSGARNNINGMGRQAGLRKGEYLKLLEFQQQQRGVGSGRGNAVYGRGVMDRNISSRKAATAREKLPAPEPEKDGFKVFFGNASALTTEEEMYGLFRQYGECSELILLRDRRQRLRGAGFVTFKNAADAMRAIEGLDRKYTVLGGTKPLEVRIPENSEQKRERIRALARLRAEIAQQQSQGKQQQQGNQQNLQLEYHSTRQQLQQSSPQQQQYVQLHGTPLSPQNEQPCTGTLHASQVTTSHAQRIPRQQQQYSEQQQHSYYEHQHREGMSLQAAQVQQGSEQQRGWAAFLRDHRRYVFGNDTCEREKQNPEQFSWQHGIPYLLGASRGSALGSSGKEQKAEADVAAALPFSTTALEALLAAAVAEQQQVQQKEQQNQTGGLTGGTADRTQDLLAWLEEYTKYGDAGVVSSVDHQRQTQEASRYAVPPPADQGKEGPSAGVPRSRMSVLREPSKTYSRSSTLHLGSAAEQIVAACVGEQQSEVEGDSWREAEINYSPGVVQGFPSVTLHPAVAASFPSPRIPETTGIAFDRSSCSTATPTGGGSAWQGGSASAVKDQKTNASPIPSVISAPRGSSAVASPSSPKDIDGFQAALSTAASDGTAPATAAAGARIVPQRKGTSPPACEETDLSYVNAVASVLSGRTTLPSVCEERNSATASLSSRAPPSRYVASPCSYSRLAPSDAAFLQSASTASPAALSPFLPPFGGATKPFRVPDSELHDGQAPTATGGEGSAGLSSCDRLRLYSSPRVGERQQTSP